MNMRKEFEIRKRKNVAIQAAKKAGKMLCDNFGKALKVKSKGDRNLVTNVDLKAENIIVGLIQKHFLQDDILSEENQYRQLGSDFMWIIDPLDGTHNYIRGIEVFGISIGLAFKKKVVLGIIYMPVLGELYVAQKGKGAYLNNRRMRVSRKRLRDTVMIYDSSIRINKKPMLASLGELADKVFNVRMFGSTVRSLSYVAEGKAEVEIEYNDNLWDFAAGLLLVEEAGGKATDFEGRPWDINSKTYVASNRIIHKDVLKMIRRR